MIVTRQNGIAAFASGHNRTTEASKPPNTQNVVAASQTGVKQTLPDSGGLAVNDNWLMRAAQDPESAANLARGMAFSYDMPLQDITGLVNGTGPARYVATGQPVTEDSTRAFNETAAKLREGRIELFTSEKAKGTPDAEIIGKVVSYMDQNAPADYLKLMEWDRISGRTEAMGDTRPAGRFSSKA